MRSRKPNLTTKQLLAAVATAKHKGTGNIATLLGYQPRGVLVKLKSLESKGLVKREQVNKTMFLWSLTKGCFGSFNGDAAWCKECQSAVECHGVNYSRLKSEACNYAQSQIQ